MIRRQVLPPACAPVECEDYESMALKALYAGNATPDQQKNAIKWILEKAAVCNYVTYRSGPDGDRDTIFICGRQFVAQTILAEINTFRVKPPNVK